jgi:transaldolase
VGAWALHHDNAPAHTAQSIQVLLASHGIPVVQQPPYSPDIAPCDFWLFPQLKTVLKGNRFEDIDKIKKNATNTLNTIPKDSFKIYFQQWQDRWKKCVSSQEECFENY